MQTCTKHAPFFIIIITCISLHNYINIVLSIVSFVLDLYLELTSMPTVVMLSETIRVEWSTTLYRSTSRTGDDLLKTWLRRNRASITQKRGSSRAVRAS